MSAAASPSVPPLPPPGRAGILLALLAAALFGASVPCTKLLLGDIDPWLAAGLLYLGAGGGLAAALALRPVLRLPPAEAGLRRADLPVLALVAIAGGLLGPLLLLLGLQHTDAAGAALLLNLEGLATMAIAWLAFHENVDARLLAGAAAILAGAALLSWQGRAGFGWGAPLIAAACLCWGIDNNLTRLLSVADPMQLAAVKGLAAGAVNVALALLRGATVPGARPVLAALLVGFLGIGVSLVAYVRAQRDLGAARTGAYFGLAPFAGALLAVPLLHEAVATPLLLAGAVMAVGVWLHVSERHDHLHAHGIVGHAHRHRHDAHHSHAHPAGLAPDEPHSHWHLHAPLLHRHAHYPDLHHRHRHASRRARGPMATPTERMPRQDGA